MTALALIGAHRTGKTTLAKAYALKSGAKFLETSVSAIHRELGFDPAVEHTFAERLTHQEKILTRVDAIYAQCAGEDFVTDRSPLDMLAYTMAETFGDRVAEEDQDRFARYVQKCIDVTNRRFGVLVVVQPGIPLVVEEGKAEAVHSRAYIEQLSALMMGLASDERVTPAHFYIPRKTVSLNERVEAVEFAVGRAQAKTLQLIQTAVGAGALLH